MDAINLTLSRDLSESPFVSFKNFVKQLTTSQDPKQMVLFQHPFSKLSVLVPFMLTAFQQKPLAQPFTKEIKQIRTSLRYTARILPQEHTKHF